jgi:hypothetical protein
LERKECKKNAAEPERDRRDRTESQRNRAGSENQLLALSIFAKTKTLERSRPRLRSFPIPAIPGDSGDPAWFSTSQAIVNAGPRYNRT